MRRWRSFVQAHPVLGWTGTVLVILAISVMLARPYVRDLAGLLIMLAVWSGLSVIAMIAWVHAWWRAHQRNPAILAGRWAKAKLVIYTGALFLLCFAIAFATGRFGW